MIPMVILISALKDLNLLWYMMCHKFSSYYNYFKYAIQSFKISTTGSFNSSSQVLYRKNVTIEALLLFYVWSSAKYAQVFLSFK